MGCFANMQSTFLFGGEMDYWIWLARIEGLGPIRKMRALQKFRRPENFYNATKKEILSIEGFGELIYKKIEKESLESGYCYSNEVKTKMEN